MAINQDDNQGTTVQELSARERLEEVTQSLRALEETNLTFDQTKRVRAMVHYNELVLAGKISSTRKSAFILGMAIGGTLGIVGCALGFLVGHIFINL